MRRPNKPKIRIANLLRLIDERFEGVTANFSRATGVRESQVTQWSAGNRNMSKETAERIEGLLGLPDGYLDREDSSLPNISPHFHSGIRIPLLPFGLATGIGAVSAQHFEANEWVQTTNGSISCVAFRVEGESMVAPAGLSFPPGTVIVVDPDRKPKEGDYVVALDPQTQRPTFKRLVSDAGRWFLRPLNPAFPTVAVDGPNATLGVVCEWQMRGTL